MDTNTNEIRLEAAVASISKTVSRGRYGRLFIVKTICTGTVTLEQPQIQPDIGDN